MHTSRSHIPALNVIIGEIDILATSWSGESAKRKSLCCEGIKAISICVLYHVDPSLVQDDPETAS